MRRGRSAVGAVDHPGGTPSSGPILLEKSHRRYRLAVDSDAAQAPTSPPAPKGPWRRTLSEGAHRPEAGTALVEAALAALPHLEEPVGAG